MVHQKNNIVLPHIGYKHKPESIEKMKARIFSNETREKIRQAHLGKKPSIESRLKRSGENSILWKGDKACLRSIHYYVRKHLPEPKFCQICNEIPPYDLANKSGKYLRDPSDWLYLCRKCHFWFDDRYDKVVKNLRSDCHKNLKRDNRGRLMKYGAPQDD